MRIGAVKDVRRFCVVDGWERTAGQPGRRVTKHEVWQKALPDGTTLRTVLSKGRGAYVKGMFAEILKHQLRVTNEEFWAAVDRGRPPDRGQGAVRRSAAARLPHDLVLKLLARGFSLDEIRGLTAEQAAALLDAE